jgi:hypothetical protein
MALSSLTVEARGLDGIPYRVDVNGGGTNLTDSNQTPQQFLRIEGGESEDRGLNAIWPKRLRLFMLNVDVSPLFGEPDRAVPVEAFNLGGSSDRKVFEGFMITDFFGDAPFAAENIVELQALDGLGTLESDGLDQIYSDGDTFVSYVDAITRILGTLYVMRVEFGTHWYPSEGNLSSSDNPLASTGFNPNNYREDRPDGGWDNQLSVLKDICRSQGLVIQQVERSDGAKWHVRQRDALNSDGLIKVWEYDNNNTLLDGPDALDRSQTISVPDGDIKRKHSRDFVRRRQLVEATHNHVSIEKLIDTPGFEDGSGDWMLLSGGDWDVNIITHDDAGDITPKATQNDDKVIEFEQSSAVSSNDEVKVFEQALGSFNEPPPEANGQLAYQHASSDFNESKIALEIDDHHLSTFYSEIRFNVKGGEGEIPVESLDRPIPEGARCVIVEGITGAPPPQGITRAEIDLSLRAKIGDTEVKGDISKDLTKFSQTLYLAYPGLRSGTGGETDRLTEDNWRRSPGWEKKELLFSLTDANGDELNGDVAIRVREVLVTDDDIIPTQVYWDNWEFSLEVRGSPIDQTVAQAKAPEFGESEAQGARLFSGPTDQNLARVKGDGFEPVSWGLGSSGGDLSLAELNARQRLRYWRNNNAKWTVTTADRDGSLRLTGDELVTFDGELYTVHSIKYDPAAGETRATLIRWKDRGTSGIELQTVLEQSDEQSASGGAVRGTTCSMPMSRSDLNTLI